MSQVNDLWRICIRTNLLKDYVTRSDIVMDKSEGIMNIDESSQYIYHYGLG